MLRPYLFEPSGLHVDLSRRPPQPFIGMLGNSYDAHIARAPHLNFKLSTPVNPRSCIAPADEFLERASRLTHGLSPTFISGDSESSRRVFSDIINRGDNFSQPEDDDLDVDHIFALSHRKVQDVRGKWPLVPEIWNEACDVVDKIVGPGKTIRFWVADLGGQRQEDLSVWQCLYAYLLWPVIFVGQTYRDHCGNLSLGTWTALQCTAGLVGHGLFTKDVPDGVGAVMQTMISHPSGFFFNQTADHSRTMCKIMVAFAAQVDSHRLCDSTRTSPETYDELHSNIIRISVQRNDHGPFFYGPLDAEEPIMLSGWRHELLSSRWQSLGPRGFTNDIEWVPMESKFKMMAALEGETPVNPLFRGVIVSTGGQSLLVIRNEHNRTTILLVQTENGNDERMMAYFRCPAFHNVKQAVRIVWEGRYQVVKPIMPTRLPVPGRSPQTSNSREGQGTDVQDGERLQPP